jgi:hypothetical protein
VSTFGQRSDINNSRSSPSSTGLESVPGFPSPFHFSQQCSYSLGSQSVRPTATGSANSHRITGAASRASGASKLAFAFYSSRRAPAQPQERPGQEKRPSPLSRTLSTQQKRTRGDELLPPHSCEMER